MDIWNILGTAQTSDENEIKRAYREQLKHNHPEVNPEGFKRLKEAYDQALKFGVVETTVQAFPEREENKSPIEEFKISFDQRLWDTTIRFELTGWQQWAKKLALLDVSSQLQISDYALDKIMDARWLPGELIHCFWEIFDWQRLMKGSERDQDLADFLVYWGGIKTQFPLEALSEFSHVQQRAILLRISPLSFSATHYNPDSFSYWWHTPMPSLTVYHPTQYLFFLKGCKLEARWPKDCLPEVIEQLLKLHSTALACDDWLLVAQASKQIGIKDLLERSLAKVLELNASNYGYVADCLKDWFDGLSQDISMAMAVIAADVMQKPKGQWQFKTQWQSKHSKEDTRYQILNHCLTSEESYATTMRPLEHDKVQDLSDEAYLSVWSGLFGSTHDLEASLARVNNQQTPSECDIAYQVLTHWLSHKKNQLAYPEWLKEVALTYASKQWFELAPLTDRQLESMSAEQWRSFYYRHPLMSDQWFRQLEANKVLDNDYFSQQDTVANWLARLGCYRTYIPDYQVLSPLAGQSFSHDIDWLLHYYHLDPEPHEREVDLPSSSLDGVGDCPLVAAKAFIIDSENDNFEQFIDMSKVGDQYVLKSIVEYKVKRISENHDLQQLAEQALTSGIYLAALTRKLLTNDQLEEGAACLALLRAKAADWPYLDMCMDYYKYSLERRLQSKGIDIAEFSYDETSYLNAICYFNITGQMDPNAFLNGELSRGSYQYAINYIVTLVYAGLDNHNFDLSGVDCLVKKREEFTDEQAMVGEVALYYLDKALQQNLEADMDKKGSRIKSHSVSVYTKLALTNTVCYGICRNQTMGIFELFSTQNMINLYVSSGLFLFSLLMFFYAYAKSAKSNRNVLVVLYPVTYVCLLWFGSLWLGILQGLMLLLFAVCITKFNLNGKWEASTVKKRRVPLFDELYSSSTEPKLFMVD